MAVFTFPLKIEQHLFESIRHIQRQLHDPQAHLEPLLMVIETCLNIIAMVNLNTEELPNRNERYGVVFHDLRRRVNEKFTFVVTGSATPLPSYSRYIPFSKCTPLKKACPLPTAHSMMAGGWPLMS